MDFNSITSQIDSLPSLSDTAHLVRELYKDGSGEIDVRHLIRIIESDALLVANILKMINSPLYGFSKQISSVSQAVTLFGTQMVSGLVVKYSIESAVIANLRSYGVSNAKFNDICHLQSSLLYKWYSTVNVEHARILAPLALIMESGKLVVAQEVAHASNIKEYLSGFKSVKCVTEYENSVFGTTSYYVSGLLFEHWHLDTLYVNMLKGLDYEHDSNSKLGHYLDILDVVRKVINVKDIFTQDSISDAVEIVEDMNLNVDDFLEVVGEMKIAYEQGTI